MKELYLDNTLVDLYGNENIPINYTNADIDKLSQGDVKGNFSYEVLLPATKTNKQLFYFPELDLEESFNGSIEKSARLEVNGVVILDGFARIKSVVKNDKLTDYKVVLFDGNSSWISAIKDEYLSDLDYSSFDHIYTGGRALDNIANALVSYSVINYGDTVNSNGKWVTEDMYPAFNVRNLLINIFGVKGYKINSNFIDGDFFKQLYITTDKIPERRNEDIVIHKFNASNTLYQYGSFAGDNRGYNKARAVSFDNQEPFDGVNYYNTKSNEVGYYLGVDGIYKTSFDGKMSFVWQYEFYNASTNAFSKKEVDYDLTFRRWRNGVYSTLESRTITVPKARGNSTITYLDEFTTTSYKVEPNDIYYFAFELKTSASGSNHYTGLTPQSSFSNKVYSTLTEGQTMYIADILPKMLQTDFIQDIKTAFNLYFRVDEISKKITIEPRNEFYLEESEDWSEKLDLSKPIEMNYLGSNLGKNIKFKYANDSNDKYVKFKEETVNDGNEWLSIEVPNTNASAKDTTTVRSLKKLASTYIGQGITTAPHARIPLIWDTESDELPTKNVKKWKPRLLYYRGKTRLPGGEYWDYNGKQYNYYKQFTINYISNDGIFVHNNTLDFNDSGYSKGLYNLHYSNTIKTINESQKYFMYLKLNSLDILNLDFRKPKYIEVEGNGDYYILQRVYDYVPDSVNTIKCEFVKVVEKAVNVDKFTSPTNIIQPPFIEEEQKEITEPVAKLSEVVCTMKVWSSTTENPSGEFVDVESEVMANVVRGSRILDIRRTVKNG